MNRNGEAMESIVLGGGCFWCTEAVFLAVRGVAAVESGYTGGASENPDYASICTGQTGHAEVVRVHYDSSVVTLATLLKIFFATHDPTTLNRQGHDVGTQYRSAIFFADALQEEVARSVLRELQAAQLFRNPIVTELTPLGRFWKAEAYHQNYFARNPHQGYCIGVVAPKVTKFRKQFAAYLR